MCNAQKKTSLENSLLQDIPILDGNDSSQLKEWLTDIETASELMGESRTKLAQEESWGLVRTLISEALTLHKTWEEIKDSLHLKICNSDIHTSISHFMDIQQKEKESLAAYIHHFKWEAAQQLTSTLLPPSLVNIMYSDDDKCFQCQETGHMAHYCPCIRCFDCDD